MAYGQVRKISSIRICTLGGNMYTKVVITHVPGHPQGSEFRKKSSYHTPRGFGMPKGTTIIKIKTSVEMIGAHKGETKILYKLKCDILGRYI